MVGRDAGERLKLVALIRLTFEGIGFGFGCVVEGDVGGWQACEKARGDITRGFFGCGCGGQIVAEPVIQWWSRGKWLNGGEGGNFGRL